MKRILFYCQHVLGMGHFMRSAALVEGLAERFEICFLNGGEIIPGFLFPPAVEVVNLPPIKSDEGFKQLKSVGEETLEAVQQQRVEQILATFARFQPDLVVIELYPFGRKKFSFELLPLLARIRLHTPKPRVVCSLRDILVSRPAQESYEAQVCDLLNRYFDLLLIHADPAFQRLEETFHSVGKFTIPIAYTGYVAQRDPAAVTGVPCGAPVAMADDIQLDDHLPLLLASIGGGRVGFELLAATVDASARLHRSWPHQLFIFSGPYLPDEHFAQLEARVANQPHIQLRRYTSRFLTYMARATLSISMAGYNTCVNILATGVRALALPFQGGDNNEQTLRAEKLAANGVITLLQPADLVAERLAAKITQTLHTQPTPATLTLDGVAQSVTRLVALAEEAVIVADRRLAHLNAEHYAALDPLRAYLTSRQQQSQQRQNHQEQSQTLHFFIRDDDIDEAEDSLRHLLDIGLSHALPLNLAVIPARLTAAGTKLVKSYKKLAPNLLELHQHGWQHLNHEVAGRKCEFGVSRTYAEQYEDIRRGKLLLEETFGERFFPAFTPPWNRCTPETLTALNQLGFKVFSKDHDKAGEANELTGYGFHEISITLNFMAKGGHQMRPPAELVELLIRQMQAGTRIGIMLHHKVMDDTAFAFLNALLAEIRRYDFVRFHTFAELHELAQAPTQRSAQLPTLYALDTGGVHVQP